MAIQLEMAMETAMRRGAASVTEIARAAVTPPASLTDRFSDEAQLNATLDAIAEDECDPGTFRIAGAANDTGISYASGVMSAAFSGGPSVETFDAQAGELSVSMSYVAPTSKGATTLVAGMMTTTTGVAFCFDGAVRPSADFEGPPYVVLAAATLYEISNGSCTTTVLGGFDNHVYACIAAASSERGPRRRRGAPPRMDVQVAGGGTDATDPTSVRGVSWGAGSFWLHGGNEAAPEFSLNTGPPAGHPKAKCPVFSRFHRLRRISQPAVPRRLGRGGKAR